MNRAELVTFTAAGHAERVSAHIFTKGPCIAAVLLASVALGLEPAAWAQEKTPDLERTVLPIPEPSYPPITELDARKSKVPPRFKVEAPAGAPNVVIVLIDDMGFGH